MKNLLNHEDHKDHQEQSVNMKEIDALSNEVIGLAIEVHRNLGLIINFNVKLLKDGIKRMVF